jgi:phosphate uptake regulator
MKRKVIQLAGRTYVVSLPSKWVKKYGIKKGDELEVTDSASNIVFSTKREGGAKKTSINIQNTNERTIRWLLSSLHKKGYDEIELFYDKSKKTAVIQELVKDLFIGFAIVHQSSKRCVLRAISQDQDKEFDNILRRAWLVTISMGESAIEYLEQGQQRQLKELITLEKTNNQLTNFCQRTLNKKGHIEAAKTCFYYVIAWNLEKICDDYKYICELLSENKTKLSKESLVLFKETNNFLRSYYELFYSFDLNKLNKLHDRKKELIAKGHKLISTKKGVETTMLNYLTGAVLKTTDFSASMIALKTD